MTFQSIGLSVKQNDFPSNERTFRQIITCTLHQTLAMRTRCLLATACYSICCCEHANLVSAYMNLKLKRSGVDPVQMTASLCPSLYVFPVKIGLPFITQKDRQNCPIFFCMPRLKQLPVVLSLKDIDPLNTSNLQN
jgi:hypothetical protein